MYLEHSRDVMSREGWKYPFKGAELLPKAKAALEKYTTEEIGSRKQMADLMLSIAVNANSKEVEDCKSEIGKAARLKEQCQVWVHCFEREPEREFNLAMGDVVFFDFPANPDQ